MSNPLDVSWTTTALDLLGLRDRFSRDAIIHEFSEAAGSGELIPQSKRVDDKDGFFSWDLMDGRYAILYEMDEPRHRVHVHAVVPGPVPASTYAGFTSTVGMVTKGKIKLS